MENPEIMEIEKQVYELTKKLGELRRASTGEEVSNYKFQTLEGEVSLLDLFGERDKLLLIHNMGQACRYCTLWADGFNGILMHLESAMSVVLVSKDDPETQRRFAASRDWKYRLASHGGGDYIREQTVMAEMENMPGAVLYERDGDRVLRKNHCIFGPGDLYSSHWHMLGLAGLGDDNWTPQFSYWSRPEKMEDGGANLPD
ncbi:DUF899 family protein [bacterium]|nr:DUF899 family protein [bacterium]